MSKNTSAENTYKSSPEESQERDIVLLFQKIWQDERVRLILGLCSLITSFALLLMLYSYFFTGANDQSVVESSLQQGIKISGAEVENWLGVMGATLAHWLVYRMFGVGSFFIVPFLFIIGWRLAFKSGVVSVTRFAQFTLFACLWISALMGFLYEKYESVSLWAGGFGYEFVQISNALLGIGTLFLLLIALAVFIIYFFKPTDIYTFFTNANAQGQSILGGISERFKTPNVNIKAPKNFLTDDFVIEKEQTVGDLEQENATSQKDLRKTMMMNGEEDDKLVFDVNKGKNNQNKRTTDKITFEVEGLEEDGHSGRIVPNIGTQKDIEFDENEVAQERTTLGNEDNLFTTETEAMVDALGNYDPKLELSDYRPPTLDLLDEAPVSRRQVTNEELESNKDRIVETLSNYGIGISQIKATIGPTVTLYEIIPEAGVRIAKIKNLEDDIALSLSALGIRIIAPIPGKGTIGIEVPNKKREVVSMRSILTDESFVNSDKELPIILGKTISNEVYVADLSKMPHLLIAGATGQGKSVGLNTFIVSLLYKKHPAELKFVLVDPKKVEMTLFRTIESHFLAKLPDESEPIITDNKKVVNTLLSLCIEMDNRYNLLKEAGCRNLKEYNRKFLHRKLNPRKGHRFLPYIVLIIDELADLMMTAGKEVEQPIARLAQLARAIGIHLIVATQRPSVNVITGIIKANFPTRLSFKVTSKIDSRTILDSGGAEQLVGMGDMLFTMGAESIRLQGAFIDTHEVERVCEYIGTQRGYPMAYELPEFLSDEERATMGDEDDEGNFERDALFEEAARIIVMHQQGSTSLLQRRLKLGYNRAGRLIDQLEKAGIVGAYEGSKAREVLIPDEYTLERLLNSMNK
ncbi:MAG: DNA translocase FtsK [Cytophagales bacterium]|nr:MAG: DNA translocase FtsK [Cytophagales bacterium]